MEWKKILVIFLIGLTGMCGIVTVDRECALMTGEGGKAGLSLTRTAKGDISLCFFGMEGEIDL